MSDHPAAMSPTSPAEQTEQSEDSSVLRVGVIGYGYWGPNIVRNFNSLQGTRVVRVCDAQPEALARAARAHAGIELTSIASDVLSATDIDVVAVVTPVWTHFDLALEALNNGKHVFVEKPFTSTVEQAEQLIELAEKKGLTIMVDHTFLFTGAVRKIRQLVEDGTLGKLYYYDSMRVNLGLFQHDVNVLWDLAPHDLSIMDFLLREEPEAVSATGQSHVNSCEDVAFLTIYFPDSLIAHINVNWLSPVKIRTTIMGGEKKMLVWNDLEPDEKVKVYDKGVNITSSKEVYNLLVSYRSGDMWAPRIEQVEALALELGHFVDCIHAKKKPISDSIAGLRVVKILEAATKSLKGRGELIRV